MPRKEENKMLKRDYEEFFLKSSPETAEKKKKQYKLTPQSHSVGIYGLFFP